MRSERVDERRKGREERPHHHDHSDDRHHQQHRHEPPLLLLLEEEPELLEKTAHAWGLRCLRTWWPPSGGASVTSASPPRPLAASASTAGMIRGPAHEHPRNLGLLPRLRRVPR